MMGCLIKKENPIKALPIVLGFLMLTLISIEVLPLSVSLTESFPFGFYVDAFALFSVCVMYVIFFAFEKKQLKVGIIPCLMLLRLLIMIINSAVKGIAVERLFDFERYAILSLAVYMFVYNFNEKFDYVRFIVNFTCVITSLQLIVSSLMAGGDKHIIGAGLGLSNMAATFVLACATYLLFKKRNFIETLVLALGAVGLFFSQSFGGYLAFAVMLVIFVAKLDWKNARFRKIFFSLLLLFVAVITVFFLTVGRSIWDAINMKLTLLLMGDFNAFGSGRVELYQFSLSNIAKDIWFGIIENIGDVPHRFTGERTHNLVLESLRLYGIVGTLINLFIMGIVFVKGFKASRADKSKKVFFYVILAVIIHGLVEPNFFTTEFSAYFWLFATAFIKPKKVQFSGDLTKLEGGVATSKIERKIVATITTFNPDLTRLKENITAVIGQVDKVVVFDNNSKNKIKIRNLCKTLNVETVFNKENVGTAGALYFGVEYAKENGYPLILTLDQDSVIETGAVDRLYFELTSSVEVAMVGCNINGEMTEETAKEGLITSGSLAKTLVLDKAGNYDKSLFIDLVDNEICFKLFRKGYDVKVCLDAKLNHNLGEQTRVKFLCVPFYTFNYSPLRLYYQYRNAVYLKKIYPEQRYFWGKNKKFSILTVIKILLGESNKCEKFKAIRTALKDGKKMYKEKRA